MIANEVSTQHGWNEEKQQRLDALSARQLAGTLNAAERRELACLIAEVETEEAVQLAPAIADLQREQDILRRKVHQSQANNEQLAALVAQQEQILADARRTLKELQRRRQVIRDAYFRVTGELLAPVA